MDPVVVLTGLEVVLTASLILDALLPLVRDLSLELTGQARYARLLKAVEGLLGCDASALLRLEADTLVPLAVRGLSADTLGRRFRIADHPRFAALMARDTPTSFDSDSPLPDPCDGLVTDAAGRLDGIDHRLAVNDPAGARRMVGRSPAMQALQRDIRTVGNSDLTVLIRGETGTGKELVAAALHAGSPRAHRPLVTINCAALPENLVESERFGHVRGAFSGAIGDRRGKFELADGGTLFLDEVGELPLVAQAKLLRVMQSRSIASGSV
jgi:anaerobic nitric oxide reductase transcription regulator